MFADAVSINLQAPLFWSLDFQDTKLKSAICAEVTDIRPMKRVGAIHVKIQNLRFQSQS